MKTNPHPKTDQNILTYGELNIQGPNLVEIDWNLINSDTPLMLCSPGVGGGGWKEAVRKIKKLTRNSVK